MPKKDSVDYLDKQLEELAANTNSTGTNPPVPVELPHDVSRKELQDISRRRMLAATQRQLELLEHYRNEPKRTIIAAPSYANYWGAVMTISINNCTVAITIDGRPNEVPETFACEFDRRREAADQYEMCMRRVSDVQNNFDGARPGQVRMI